MSLYDVFIFFCFTMGFVLVIAPFLIFFKRGN